MQISSNNAMIIPLSTQSGNGKGGVILLISFILSVLASIVAYYICKWLGGKDDNN